LVSCTKKTATSIETYKVQVGNIVQTVTSSGFVDASEKKNYSLQTSGEVLEALNKGAIFKKGDTLIKLDNSKTQLLITQAEENLKTAENSIEIAKINYQQALNANHIAIQLADANAKQSEQATQNAFKALENANGAAEASLNSARISIDNANINLEKLKASKPTVPSAADEVQIAQAEGSVSSAQAAYEQAKASAQSQADSAEGAYEQALNSQSASYWNNLNSTEAAQAQIKLTRKNIEQAEAQLELSKINLEIAKLDFSKNQISAPFDGIVLTSNYNQGEFASPGPAMSIISNIFVVKADINETDINKLKVGQEVDITLDAYPDKHFSGKVSDISPISKNTAGIITFEVTVKPDDSASPGLLYGISANLTITILKTENVLLVPIQAVYEENGKQYVDMPSTQDKTIKKVEVTTGESDYDNIEIKSGLKEGDIIFTSKAQLPASSGSDGGLGIFRMSR